MSHELRIWIKENPKVSVKLSVYHQDSYEQILSWRSAPTLHPVYQADLHNDSIFPQNSLPHSHLEKNMALYSNLCKKTLPQYINASQNRTGVTRHPGPPNTRARNLMFFAEQEYLKADEQLEPFSLKQDKSEKYWHLVLVQENPFCMH